MDFFREQITKKTRIPKKCWWCDEMIEIGQPKVHHAYTVDNEFSALNYHPECVAACDILMAKDKFGFGLLPDRGSMERGKNSSVEKREMGQWHKFLRF